jgi:diacylglycerol kinase (ATP)
MPAASPALKSHPDWVVIVNPASANGETGRKWPRHEVLLKNVLPSFEVWHTGYPGHGGLLAQQAVETGFSTIAVHGGDGTINEVVNGLMAAGEHHTTLAILPFGTGTDLVRSLGVPRHIAKAAEMALKSPGQLVDVGLVEFIPLEGQKPRRYFINVTDVGFGGDLVNYVNSHSKALGGRLSFFRGLLVTLWRYKNHPVQVALDEEVPFQVYASSIVVANGQYFGGGMWVAPEARVNDGFFEVVVVGDVSKTEVVANMGRLYRGTLAKHPKVSIFRARSLELTSKEEVLIDMDGELVGRLPARFLLLPRKIRVLFPSQKN